MITGSSFIRSFMKLIKVKGNFFQLLLLLLLPVYWACAQSKPVIRKTYGYYSERLPGNIPVDQQGNPLPGFGPDTIYTFFADSKAAGIIWDTAWIGEKAYTIVAEKIRLNSIEAGIEKSNGQPIVIKAGNGGILWRLDLVLLDTVTRSRDLPKKWITIKGSCKGKSFEMKISNLIELLVPSSV